MTVYVDRYRAKYRRMVLCHMLADSDDELHEMAAKIGVARHWFQSQASTAHYDICLTKRALAIKLGAVEVTRKELVDVIRKKRKL